MVTSKTKPNKTISNQTKPNQANPRKSNKTIVTRQTDRNTYVFQTTEEKKTITTIILYWFICLLFGFFAVRIGNMQRKKRVANAISLTRPNKRNISAIPLFFSFLFIPIYSNPFCKCVIFESMKPIDERNE